MDELAGAPAGPLALPLPADPRALAAAMRVLGSPVDGVSLNVLARECGVGARTLERLFRTETGMPFGLWRQKARLLESIRLLVESRSVTHAALESGYASVSAYIAAFKQTFGSTPRNFWNSGSVGGV
jgi:AraC-like DNA-binding protein